MAESAPTSAAVFAVGSEDEIQGEITSKSTTEDCLIDDSTSKQQNSSAGQEGDESSPNSDVIAPETSDHAFETPTNEGKMERDKLPPGTAEMDAYEEITKSEVTSLDDWENVHKSCLSEIPPVDPEILNDLELRANDIAGNLDHMLGTLANGLKAMSQVSTECLGVYGASVDHISETVDVNIKSMYTLIARCEELNASLKPVQHLAEQVKEIKKTLDIFEAICK